MSFQRPLVLTLIQRLTEPRQKIQVLSGARQVGKTTLSVQALKKITQPYLHVIAESGYTTSWLDQQSQLSSSCHCEPLTCLAEA